MRILKSRKLLLPALLALISVGLAGPAWAGSQVIGSQGAVLRVVSGAYGELFAGGTEASPESRVLALDIQQGATSQRLLVPGTEAVFEEYSPTLVHDSRAEVTWLLWEGLHNGLHPLLYLRSFDAAGWGELIELSGSPFSRKGHPQLVVTRDRSMEKIVDAAPVEVERTILHVFWWEEQGTELRKRYSPLVLEAGRFIGNHPVRDLSELFPADPASTLPALGELMRVQPGATAGSVLAGFVEQDAGRVVALELEVVPRALSRLAEDVSDFVQGQSADQSLENLSNLVRARIAETGVDLHPATVDYLKQSVAALIAGMDPATPTTEGMESIGRRAGMHILIIGHRQTVQISQPEPDEIITASRFGNVKPWHHLRLAKVASRPFPADVGEGAQLFLSKGGQEACLAWSGEGKVVYRESAGEGWAEPQQILLTESLDRNTVMAILEERTRDR